MLTLFLCCLGSVAVAGTGADNSENSVREVSFDVGIDLVGSAAAYSAAYGRIQDVPTPSGVVHLDAEGDDFGSSSQVWLYPTRGNLMAVVGTGAGWRFDVAWIRGVVGPWVELQLFDSGGLGLGGLARVVVQQQLSRGRSAPAESERNPVYVALEVRPVARWWDAAWAYQTRVDIEAGLDFGPVAFGLFGRTVPLLGPSGADNFVFGFHFGAAL